MKTSTITLAIVGIAAMWSAPVSAQNISGQLSGTLGPGTYIVVGNCYVNAGDTLNIRPGTELRHTGFFVWTINGILQASGTEASPIRFIPDQPIQSHRWRGIRFPSASSSGSVLDHCVIADCDSSDRPGGGVFCDHADITLSNSVVTNCFSGDGGGVYATYSNIVIENCEISDNSAFTFRTGSHQGTNGNGGGIYFYHCAAPVIRGSKITGNWCQGA